MKKSYTTIDAIKRWDTHARKLLDGFDPDEGDPHRIVLLNPVLMDLLGPVRGKRILDAGCGEGYLSRKLAKLGAEVTGVDFSREMLAMARERTNQEAGIRYIHGNCEDLSFLDEESFDTIVSNMVMQDLADHRAFLRSIHRVLVTKGILVISFSHPCFITPDSGWVKEENGRKLYWKVDQYFSEGAYEEHVLFDPSIELIFFHRTLSEYLRSLLISGFELIDFVEPKPDEEMLDKYPGFRDDFRMSHFIVIKVRKV
jgi:ubiquinone/menaquinone biosynthesis C-methylase UbiE